MRKVIAGIKMTLDGFCDHTAMIADDELHQHYNELLLSGSALVYGRVTYQLMESFWPNVVNNPTGNKPIDEFAGIIDNIPKIVFSNTLKNVSWKNSKLAKDSLKEEILELKQSNHGGNGDILVGSRSLIIALLNLQLIDEFQICVMPVILGKGLALFENISDRIELKLIKTKTFNSGSVTFYYEPINFTNAVN